MKRRDLLKAGAIAGGSLLLPMKLAFAKAASRAWGQVHSLAFTGSPALGKFIDPINGLGNTGIPVALPTADPNPIPNLAYDYYQMQVGEYTQQLHSALPATKLWGYADAAHGGLHRYLGGVIVAQKGRPVKMTLTNNLPLTHFLPLDTSILGADLGANRTCVHLHGGEVPWTSDGGPWAWFSSDNRTGTSFLNPGPGPNQADYFYPNNQSARLVWYHDHAVGVTRLNAYAGIASAYIIRDNFENRLIGRGIIPAAEVPLIIQDKSFFDTGDLYYPDVYDGELGPGAPLPVPSCVPEFFADTMLVNSAVFPFLEVEQRRYRFRILNGCQSRFLNLQLYMADGSGTEADLDEPGPAFIQFGTEGGFLSTPVVLNNPPKQIGFDPATGNANSYTLLLAPAERADLIIDFSEVPTGTKLILYNDATAPFPAGDPANDHQTPGAAGPNTRTIMQFRVVPQTGSADPFDFAKTLQALKKALAPLYFERLKLGPPAFVRDLTLNEDFDEFGRLRQLLGTNVATGPGAFGRAYADLATEVVHKGSTETWRIFNLSGDTHPIHFHLVNVLVKHRRPFDAANFNGKPVFTGPAKLADPNERGWKETVRMNPGEMTTVKMKFNLAKVPFPVPKSPRTGGHEFVWHCHILEHEEHDMMRPLVVL